MLADVSRTAKTINILVPTCGHIGTQCDYALDSQRMYVTSESVHIVNMWRPVVGQSSFRNTIVAMFVSEAHMAHRARRFTQIGRIRVKHNRRRTTPFRAVSNFEKCGGQRPELDK